MTTTTPLILLGKMYESSIENHGKIAAFLAATAKHLEPLKFPETAAGRNACIPVREVQYEGESRYAYDDMV